MYTAVLERTREIGILKSLGASKSYIVSVVLRETALFSIAGIIVGIAGTFVIRRPSEPLSHPALSRSRSPGGPYAHLAFIGALLGALYPALKAAQKDPIDALAYE